MYTEKVANNIFKIKADSNVYFLDFKEKIIVDTGSDSYKGIVRKGLSRLVDLDKIKKVIFTHLHYDHTGNPDLFRNAKFFASSGEIEDFRKDPKGASVDYGNKLSVELSPLGKLEGFKIINFS